MEATLAYGLGGIPSRTGLGAQSLTDLGSRGSLAPPRVLKKMAVVDLKWLEDKISSKKDIPQNLKIN